MTAPGASEPQGRLAALVVAGAELRAPLIAAISSLGLDTAGASTARDAVSAMGQRRPDLVVVDATAAELDGFAVIRKLRAAAPNRFIPILAVCPLGDGDAKRRGLEAGADDFVTKPIADIELSLRVRAVLRLRRVSDELGRTAAALETATVTDGLTALYNERAMRVFVLREFARARRYHRALSLLIVDVDGLRRVNEVQGHEVGNRVLVDVADLVRREIREADVAGREAGTFWILAPETDSESAMVMAERLRRSVNQSTPATVSIGVAAMPAVMASTADALLDLSQTALGRAKAEGRNCCRTVRR